MSKQIITNAEVESATNSSKKIRVAEYKSTDSWVFAVYFRNRCWKRFSPINSAGPALWFEQDTSKNRPLESTRRKKWLDRIWKRRDSYRRVRRYPRSDEKGERLLSDLADAHASGERDIAITLLDQIKNHFNSSVVLGTNCSIWNALPRFDPTLVKKTKWLIHRPLD
jgi:hypothetical protein